MSCHFMDKLLLYSGNYDYELVRRWTRSNKLKSIGVRHYGGIMDVDKVIIPVHLGNHWVCCLAFNLHGRPQVCLTTVVHDIGACQTD